MSTSGPTIYAKNQLRAMRIFYDDIVSALRKDANTSATETKFTKQQILTYIARQNLPDLKTKLQIIAKTYNSYNNSVKKFNSQKTSEYNILVTLSTLISLVCFASIVGYFYYMGKFDIERYTIYHIIPYFILLGIWVISLDRLVNEIALNWARKSGLGDDVNMAKTNNDLASVAGYYALIKNVTNDPTSPTAFKEDPNYKIITESADKWAGLENFINDFTTYYADPNNPTPSNAALDDLSQIQKYFDSLELFMNKRFQGAKYKDITAEKVLALATYLGSEAINPVTLSDTATSLEKDMKEFKEALLSGLISTNVMLSYSTNKTLYAQLTRDIQKILGETMFQYSIDSIITQFQKILQQTTSFSKNQRIIDNQRRLVANARVLTNFVFKDVMMEAQLNPSIIPNAPVMYVNKDTFNSMINDMSVDAMNKQMKDTESLYSVVSRAAARVNVGNNEMQTRENESISTASLSYTFGVIIATIALIGYLYDQWKIFVNGEAEPGEGEATEDDMSIAAKKLKKETDEKNKLIATGLLQKTKTSETLDEDLKKRLLSSTGKGNAIDDIVGQLVEITRKKTEVEKRIEQKQLEVKEAERLNKTAEKSKLTEEIIKLEVEKGALEFQLKHYTKTKEELDAKEKEREKKEKEKNTASTTPGANKGEQEVNNAINSLFSGKTRNEITPHRTTANSIITKIKEATEDKNKDSIIGEVNKLFNIISPHYTSSSDKDKPRIKTASVKLYTLFTDAIQKSTILNNKDDLKNVVKKLNLT